MRSNLPFVVLSALLWAAGPATAAPPASTPDLLWKCSQDGHLQLEVDIDYTLGRFVLQSAADVSAAVRVYEFHELNTPRVSASPYLTQTAYQLADNPPRTLTITYAEGCGDPAHPPFKPDGSYVVEIAANAFEAAPDKPFDISLRFGAASIAAAADIDEQKKAFMVATDNVGMGIPPNEIKVVRKQLRLDPKASDIVLVKDAQTFTARPYRPGCSTTKPAANYAGGPKIEQFCLDGSTLHAGQEYQLTTNPGLTDVQGLPLVATGTLKPAAAPKAQDSKLTAALSMVASAHKSAVFTLAGTFAPLHKLDVISNSQPASADPAEAASARASSGIIYLDPSLSVDVGLRSTDSKNAVTFNGLFRATRHLKDAGDLKVCAEKQARAYCTWKTTPASRLTDISFAFGPRAEVDRDFKRLNLLAVGRSEFNFYRWMGSLSDQKYRIQHGLTDPKAYEPLLNSLDGPHFGFNLVPYIELNAGGHATDETLTNKGHSVDVPHHVIFRVYAGINPSFEVYRWKFAIDESLIELAHQEQIGLTTTTGVQLLKISGVHHHGLASIDYFLDPDRHYSFGVKYENGRAAPNFNYLSKFTAGLNFVY